MQHGGCISGHGVRLTVDRTEPKHHFSFRWHPFAVDPSVDYSSEWIIRVVFELKEVVDGTLLSVPETGFDGIPSPAAPKRSR